MGGTCGIKTLGGRTYHCPVELALQVIGGKWKPLILWHLGADGTLRFSQLKRRMPRITQKMLTQQLRELEADGVVERTVYAQVPPRVDYALTAFGATLKPVLEALCRWGAELEARLEAEPEDARGGPDAKAS